MDAGGVGAPDLLGFFSGLGPMRAGHALPPRRARPAVSTGCAGVDHVCQRHASLRSRSFAFDSVSNALAIRCCRFGATRRRVSLTVSFKVFGPSS
jgi:hypothetical protein